MKHGKTILFLALPLLLVAAGCNNEPSDNKSLYDVDSLKVEADAIKKAKKIFYQMYLPSEMYKVFEKAGAIYEPDILNQVENVNLYETSIKASLNLGVYGVDLSYNKMFGQNQKTLLYFTVIHKLSQQLGIPDNQFASALRKMEKNIANRDSLTKYATNIYVSTNHFLNENERQSTAAMIITGGWIESLYISSKIADENPSNEEIVNRIAFQKYSLRTLVSLLENYQGDENVTKFLIMLKVLKKAFDKFEIYYEPGDVNIDTVNKLISANKIEFNIQKEDIRNIKKIICEIRKEVIQ